MDRGSSRRSSDPSQRPADKPAGGGFGLALPAGLHFTGDADEDAAMLEALEVRKDGGYRVAPAHFSLKYTPPLEKH